MWTIDSLYPRFSRFCCLTVVLNLFGTKNPLAISSHDGIGLGEVQVIDLVDMFSTSGSILSIFISFHITCPSDFPSSSHLPMIFFPFPIDFPWISHRFSHLACWPLPCPTGHSGPIPKCQAPGETQRVGAWTYAGDFVVDFYEVALVN